MEKIWIYVLIVVGILAVVFLFYSLDPRNDLEENCLKPIETAKEICKEKGMKFKKLNPAFMNLGSFTCVSEGREVIEKTFDFEKEDYKCSTK